MRKKQIDSAPTRKTILELTHDEARSFFLKQESYCTMDMPPYITFQPILDKVDKVLLATALCDCKNGKTLRDYDDVNHTVYNNKDGRFAWRPIELIHPALYVALVHSITEKGNWDHIVSRFMKFSKNTSIRCLSIPVVSLSKQKDKAEQILKWWEEIEQQSLELSLDFECLVDTDLSDCYGSIYTHSIAWALHSKAIAKDKNKRKDKSLIGNIIDDYVQDMSYGQTNGIPQGSVLMDFIAEMILGYADRILSVKLRKVKLHKNLYHILRYRDDYRIFVKDTQTGELIVKYLTETMIGLGLKLNPAKTKISNEIVHSSLKVDKIRWIEKNIGELPYYKSLMVIHEHARLHPNSGSLIRALNDFHAQIAKKRERDKYLLPKPLIGIVVDIAYRNPKTYPVCAAILSVLMRFLTGQECQKIMNKITKKFDLIPNTGYMEIWLQRVAVSAKTKTLFSELICRLVTGDSITLWNSAWISSKSLKNAIDEKLIVNKTELAKCSRKRGILQDEIALFIAKMTDYSK